MCRHTPYRDDEREICGVHEAFDFVAPELSPHERDLWPVPEPDERFDLDLELVDAPPDGPYLSECSNAVHNKWLQEYAGQEGRRAGTYRSDRFCIGGMLFVSLWAQCRNGDMWQCYSEGCTRRRRILFSSMPLCKWKAFRNLVLTVLSCRKLPFLEAISDSIELATVGLPEEQYKPAPFSCIDLPGVLDIWRWAWNISGYSLQKSVQPRLVLGSSLFTSLQPSGWHLVRGYFQQGYCCRHRFWNLAHISRFGIADLPHIAWVAAGFSRDQDSRTLQHDPCTEDTCFVGFENSTLVPQAHKCAAGACEDQITFSPALLNEAYQQPGKSRWPGEVEWRQTAWATSSVAGPPMLCKPNDRIMAVSHVWSDGTGVGRKSPGTVNTCLFAFFAELAAQLDCTGIWWDTISLPTDQVARREAMSTMLWNYEYASVTVVHDEELTELEYKDDGSPAVALLLSPWFTRGWTAAELFASRGHPVKVLFKNPDPSGPPLVLKDLDTDILAFDTWSVFDLPDVPLSETGFQCDDDLYLQARQAVRHATLSPPLGYFVASQSIQRLRKNRCFESINNRGQARALEFGLSRLPDLLSIMRSRTTSWHRDRMIIAGLMALSERTFDVTATALEITQRILLRYGWIPIKDLYHASMTAFGRGPWSWCPASIHDFGHFHRSGVPREWCYIEQNGRIRGVFRACPLFDRYSVTPVSLHPAVSACVSSALLCHQSCLLLTHDNYEGIGGPLEDRVFILAVAERQSREPPYGFVSCIWVACVRVAGFASEQVFWESSHNINACFGADNPSREQTMRYADIEFADGFIWAVKPGNDQKDEQKGSAAASPP